MICVHTFWHECNFWEKIITMLCNDVKLQYFVNTASSSNSPCGGDMNAPKVSYHMFLSWSRDKFFVNLISRIVVGGALEVVLVAAVVLWFVMVGDGGDDEKRKSIPGSGLGGVA